MIISASRSSRTRYVRSQPTMGRKVLRREKGEQGLQVVKDGGRTNLRTFDVLHLDDLEDLEDGLLSVRLKECL